MSRQARAKSMAANIGWLAVLAALTVGLWWLWLGHDTTYQIDAAGDAGGPYQSWQVVGCALTYFGLAVAAAVLIRWPAIIVMVMAGALTWAWSVPASAGDDTGLWAVGAVMLLFGTTIGAVVAVVVGRVLARRIPTRLA